MATINKIDLNGDVYDIESSHIVTIQPANPTEGATYYDTTNNVVKVYDGTNWVEVGKEYHAGEGISIGTVQDYSAMRGPCPEGFHVPLNTEWQAVYNVWTTLGGGSSDGINFGIALKLPFAGIRADTSAVVRNQGYHGSYWSSSRANYYANYLLHFVSDGITPQDIEDRAEGCSVRCFKDVPIVPTDSWTKLYGTSIESGGIFWSSSDGLISLSGDGSNWITIADKNLGATTVWNSGDTLSETNCGGYFQWGNNYMFPFTGNVTTSSTQVDASNYGPGNYYSSNTFITYNGSWDSSDNRNLRGGVTGVVTIDNVITNTGVLSVNGETGHVTVDAGEASSITTTQPSNPVEGDVYYDTTNDVVKVYDGTQWNEIGKEYNAGEGIEIVNGNDYSAMRGMVDSGFHIPQYSELTGLKSTMQMIGQLTDDERVTKLHIPLAGTRLYDGSVIEQGTVGTLWTCTPNGTATAYPFRIYATRDIYSVVRSCGRSIRAFKDVPAIPDSTWITVAGNISVNAGIFWNPTLGLISICADGHTRYTIKDKNEGATVVYNSGDELSEANCGKYYQWGNCYGFPRASDATIKTSSTQVDASGYGPGNYYYSDTFITGNGDWSSVQNDNLWGYTTGVSTVTNTIFNRGVLSVNGETGDVFTPTDYLSTEKTNSPYTPSEDYDPVTKKYVDDNALPIDIPIPAAELAPVAAALFDYFQAHNGVGYPLINVNGKLYEYSGWSIDDDIITLEYVSTTLEEGILYRIDHVDKVKKYKFIYTDGEFTRVETDGSWYFGGEVANGCPLWVVNSSSEASVIAATFGDMARFLNEYGVSKSMGIVYDGWYYLKIHTYSTDGDYRKVIFIRLYPQTSNYNSGYSRTFRPTLYLYFTYDSGTGYTYDHYDDSYIIVESPSVLATNVNYSTPYTPAYDGSPATKKYVDDSVSGAISAGTTAPSNPTEGQIWYDTTNDVVKVYDGTNWNEVGVESNTKTFYLTTGTSSSALQKAQECYDWYKSGKNPIVSYNGTNYILAKIESTRLTFQSTNDSFSVSNNSTTLLRTDSIYLSLSGDSVTAVYASLSNVGKLLATDVDYSTPYTPLYNGSPATKKYVDDTVASAKSSGATAPSNPTEGQLWYDTTNDVLKVYNGSQWNEIGGDVKVFSLPSVNDDITDILDQLTLGKGVIFHETASLTSQFYKVDSFDDVNNEIVASVMYPYGDYVRSYTINYNYGTKMVVSINRKLSNFFAPETAGTQGQVLTKTNSGYEWANASGGDVMVSSQPNNILTSGMKIWAGEETDYSNLGTYDTNTVYLTIPDGSVQAIDNNENLPNDAD